MQDTDFHFRDSHAGDLTALQKLVDALYIEDARPGAIVVPKIDATFQELQSHPDKGRLISIVVKENVVGYCILINFWSNEYSGDIIEVDEIFIDKENRGRGLATQFFVWLGQEFSDQAVGFSLQVTPENIRARQLYERLGFSLSPNVHFIKLCK
jgi:GNAT superfamily N-acetyltransferase